MISIGAFPKATPSGSDKRSGGRVRKPESSNNFTNRLDNNLDEMLRQAFPESDNEGSDNSDLVGSAPSSIESDDELVARAPRRTFVPGAQQSYLSPRKPTRPKLDPLPLDAVVSKKPKRGSSRRAKTERAHRTTKTGRGDRSPLKTGRTTYRTRYYEEQDADKPGRIYSEVYHKTRPPTLIDKVVSSLKFHVNELVTHVDGADASLERFHRLLRAQHDADAEILEQEDERLL